MPKLYAAIDFGYRTSYSQVLPLERAKQIANPFDIRILTVTDANRPVFVPNNGSMKPMPLANSEFAQASTHPLILSLTRSNRKRPN